MKAFLAAIALCVLAVASEAKLGGSGTTTRYWTPALGKKTKPLRLQSTLVAKIVPLKCSLLYALAVVRTVLPTCVTAFKHTLILRTESLASTNQTVAIVGEDIDLLIIMMGLSTSPNVYLLKPGKEKTPQLLYQPQSAVKQNLAKHMMFLHAMSGCDSTSSLEETVGKFLDLSVQQVDIAAAGEKFVVALYEADHLTTSLNVLRYKHKCRTYCGSRCGSRRADLFCRKVCINCPDTCTNVDETTDLDGQEDDPPFAPPLSEEGETSEVEEHPQHPATPSTEEPEPGSSSSITHPTPESSRDPAKRMKCK
ncbi:unnamed protein product [Ceutorhynchus assimilis]|uniref:Uncharacterized protein n=1 Tax=Ceutorhynchus assimilis TaxID=467358 RepID=A0A9N9MT75_9CUCU|nr:unnamed protein product [Ceutorhynchus assimilis]